VSLALLQKLAGSPTPTVMPDNRALPSVDALGICE
jgi:hypothetical protein